MSAELPSWSEFLAAWPLFRDPVLCAAAAGAVLGVLGLHIVMRRMVFVAASLSQTSGLGVALTFFAAIHLGYEPDPLIGAILASGLAAGVASLDLRRLHLGRDALLALLWLLAGGAALMVGDRISQEAHDINGILFGTAVLVRPEDLRAVLLVGGLAGLFLLTCWRGVVFAGFDPDGARVQGLPVRALDLGLLLAVTLMVAVGTRALGALPVFAFSVLPAQAALLCVRHLGRAVPLSLLFGVLSGALGYLLAFFLSFPVGASQTVVAAGFVLLGLLARLLRGGRD